MEPIFTTETIHDLSVHNEFRKGVLRANTVRGVLNLLGCLLIVWYITLFENPRIVYIYLALAAFLLVLHLLNNRKGGDIQYKRMLQVSGGEPQHLIIHIYEDLILCTDHRNGNRFEYRYDLFRYIIDTPHLLIAVMQHNTCLVLEKRWLRGGNPDELTRYLFDQCPNIKRKKVRSTAFGKWAYRLFALFLVIGTIIALCNLPGISLRDKLTGKLTNDMSYQEMAEELAPLGITISNRTIEELEAYDAEYAAEYSVDYYSDISASKVSDLLYWEGSGHYDEETWEWTPSTSGIYWFDTEVWNVSTIYTDFLTGVSAMNPELHFANIQEDYSAADLELGSGTVRFRFDWQGKTYSMEAAYQYDWFDTSVLDTLCDIIREDGTGKELYYAFDGGQGMFLYYAEPDMADAFEKLTGIYFTDSHFLYS